MRKRTTTKQLHNALSNNLLTVERAESYNKTTRKTDEISIDTFKDGLDFLCETIFSDAIGWHYEDNCDDGSDYIADCFRMDRSVNVIVTVYLKVGDGVSIETVEKELLFRED